MTTPQVWVSATSQDIDYDGHTPGTRWKLVGEIDTTQESDFFTYIQVFIVGRRTVKGPPEFYLDGDPDSEWVQQSKNQQPFWVAINPWGKMRASIHGAHPTYLVSNAKAKVTSLIRRPPENHPGRTTDRSRCQSSSSGSTARCSHAGSSPDSSGATSAVDAILGCLNQFGRCRFLPWPRSSHRRGRTHRGAL